MKNYKISEELAQAILNYLSERPVKEVLNLFQALQQIKQIEEPQPDKVDSKVDGQA